MQFRYFFYSRKQVIFSFQKDWSFLVSFFFHFFTVACFGWYRRQLFQLLQNVMIIDENLHNSCHNFRASRGHNIQSSTRGWNFDELKKKGCEYSVWNSLDMLNIIVAFETSKTTYLRVPIYSNVPTQLFRKFMLRFLLTNYIAKLNQKYHFIPRSLMKVETYLKRFSVI